MTDHTHTSDACGCCQPPASSTPIDVRNRPGLAEIDYRVGTFATFRQAMIEAIGSATVTVESESAPRRPLGGWTARSSDDYGIALLEMWAYVADILTFYQERIANEAFLRTSEFRESLVSLAAMLDYKPAAGMAATAYLAFSVEAGKQVEVPQGLLVQSVPGQDEKPQKFETVEPLKAESRLNRLRIYPRPQEFDPGTENNRVVTALTDVSHVAPADNLVVWTEHDAGDSDNLHVEDKKVVDVRTVDWRREVEFTPPIRRSFAANPHWQKWTRKIRLFGHNAPSAFLTPTVSSGSVTFTRVEYHFDTSANNQIYLDAVYDDFQENTKLLVVSRGNNRFAKRVNVLAVEQVQAEIIGTSATPATAATAAARDAAATAVPLIQAAVTRVTIDEDLGALDSRYTVIYELQEPEVFVWNYQYLDAISIDEDSAELYLPLAAVGADMEALLKPQRQVLLADGTGEPFTGVVGNADVEMFPTDPAPPAGIPTVRTDHLRVPFTSSVSRKLREFQAVTAVLYANVAKSTHGAAIKEEVLGSGDAAAEFQVFSLKKSPVTHVPQPGAPGGAANTLQVRVDGVRWREVKSLHGQPAEARVYTTKIDHDGVMHVQFGDGETGVRLPTGKNNVIAAYRQALGRDGNVVPDRIKTLLDRPVGLTAVTNVDQVRGGAEPESMDQVRQNVPNTVRTFGRIVSLRDFEDAAREFAGIAKARAFVDGIGVQQRVRLTVAGDEGAEVLGPALKNLVDDLDARRDPNRAMTVGSYRRVPIQIEVAIWVDPNYVAEQVRSSAVETLKAFMRFDNLDLGQPIHLSDVYKATHDVKGVVAADANRLQFKNADARNDVNRQALGTTDAPVQPRLPIFATELAVIEDPISDMIVTVETTRP